MKNITFNSRSKFLFKFVGHGFPMNALFISIVILSSLPQLLECLSSQHLTQPHIGMKYLRKQELLEEIWNPPLTTSGCQWKWTKFHSTVRSMTQFCYVYVLSRFGLRTSADVKLYIGLFVSKRSEELSAFTIDGESQVQTIKNVVNFRKILAQHRI